MFHYDSAQNSPELSLLKILPLAYYHSHFLAATLDFTSFFTTAFLHFFNPLTPNATIVALVLKHESYFK